MSPPTPLQNLQQRQANITAELAAMGQKPSASVGGQSVQWESYRASLIKELLDLATLINQLCPYEIQTSVLPWP
jgi:hypothetical protein